MLEEKKTKRLHTLINLLDVNDDDAYNEVTSQILAFGPDAIGVLEQEWLKLPDTERQERLLYLIQKLHLEKVYHKLTIWTKFYENDIMEGYLAVSQYLYSDLDKESVEGQLQQIREDLRYELHESLTPLQKIRVMNHILFDVHKFKVNITKESLIESNFLNNLLETKKGSPIGLGLLYMILAQDFGIPLYGLPLQHHFILAYMEADFPGEVAQKSSVNFYINPHFKGAAFTANEITRYLKETGQEPSDKFFKPRRNTALIRTLLNNLQKIYTHFKDVARAEEVAYLAEALKK